MTTSRTFQRRSAPISSLPMSVLHHRDRWWLKGSVILSGEWLGPTDISRDDNTEYRPLHECRCGRYLFMHNGNVGGFGRVRRKLMDKYVCLVAVLPIALSLPFKDMGILRLAHSLTITYHGPFHRLSDSCFEYVVANGASDTVLCFAIFLNQLESLTVQYNPDQLRLQVK